MQFVNDDMDDELFRRAAEEYPLITGNGDWNDVLNKMQGGNKTDGTNKKGYKSKYLFLLALIPLLLICTTFIKNDSRFIKNGSRLPAYLTAKEEGTKQLSLSKIEKEKENLEAGKTSEQQHKLISKPETITIHQRRLFRGDYNHERNIDFIGTTSNNNNKESFASGSIEQKINNGFEKNETESETTDANKNTVNKQQQGERNHTIDQHDSLTDAAETTEAGESNATPLTTTNPVKKKQKANGNPLTKFYFGFQAGPDFSMVKSTKTNGAGYSVGLLAGFNLSKSFALETGVLWDRKQYQSEGQYFKTEKLDWPHVTILDLSGFCNMYEIPLNIRYNLSSNSKRTFYANAGVSSYFMKKENYDYSYERYGVYYKGSREYKNSTNNWLSVAHLSIGVQKKLGSLGDFRIEPYAKLPLKGVGIGSMPLSSTGIYFGITRPIR